MTTTTIQFNALLLDIEGTITSISFVKVIFSSILFLPFDYQLKFLFLQDELFPYAFENVGNYLEEHYDNPATQIIVEDLRHIADQQAENDVAVVLVFNLHSLFLSNLCTLQADPRTKKGMH